MAILNKEFDVIAMLKVMDRHMEAVEFEAKFNNFPKEHRQKVSQKLPEPGSALLSSSNKPSVCVERVNGRRVIRRVLATPRQEFKAKVLMTRHDRYLKGQIANISKTGVFVVAEAPVFQENETVRLYIKPYGSSEKFKVLATVTRFVDKLGFQKGYGLKFLSPLAA